MSGKLNQIDFERLDVLGGIFIRSFIVGTVAILFVWGVMFVAGDSVNQLQQSITGLSFDQLNIALYCFLTLLKCLNVALFLVPWVAIRWYLRGHWKVEG